MVPTAEQEGGFSTAKTVLVVAIVMGCFAVLYPKIFYPMLFETSYNHKPKSGKSRLSRSNESPISKLKKIHHML